MTTSKHPVQILVVLVWMSSCSPDTRETHETPPAQNAAADTPSAGRSAAGGTALAAPPLPADTSPPCLPSATSEKSYPHPAGMPNAEAVTTKVKNLFVTELGVTEAQLQPT